MERFQNMALRCPSSMTQATLVETCRHNLQTSLLAYIGVVKRRICKQLVQQGEQAEEIVARVKAEKTSPNLKSQQGTRQKYLSSQKGRIHWQHRQNLPLNLSRPERVVLQVSCMPTGSTPSKMSTSIRCSSYSTRATD